MQFEVANSAEEYLSADDTLTRAREYLHQQMMREKCDVRALSLYAAVLLLYDVSENLLLEAQMLYSSTSSFLAHA